MTSFKDRQWSERFQKMGDEAEGEFLKRHPAAHRLGLNRPAWRVHDMPTDEMKCTPDFMLSDRLVEVMGFGKDGLLKLKHMKADALGNWLAIGPVTLWVWDSSTHRCWEAHVDEWVDACWSHGVVRHFHDNGQPYHELPVSHFPKESQC